MSLAFVTDGKIWNKREILGEALKVKSEDYVVKARFALFNIQVKTENARQMNCKAFLVSSLILLVERCPRAFLIEQWKFGGHVLQVKSTLHFRSNFIL